MRKLVMLFVLAAVGGMSVMGCRARVVTPAVVPVTPVVNYHEEWVHLPARVLFPTSDPTVDPQQRAIIEESVRTFQLRDDIVRIRCEGHADSHGDSAANMQLSIARAQAVADIIASMGVPRAQIEVVGYGETRRIVTDSAAMNSVQNRRVEFSILVRRVQ